MDRIKIVAGTRKIGDQLCGKTITGFGKTWSQRVTDDSACAYGMEPGLDYYPDVTLQYAYLGEAVQS